MVNAEAENVPKSCRFSTNVRPPICIQNGCLSYSERNKMRAMATNITSGWRSLKRSGFTEKDNDRLLDFSRKIGEETG
jgi:hypothetical protein